jgi:hypothetical protein
VVYVVPAGHRITILNREDNRHEYVIHVGVFRPLADSGQVSQVQAGLDDVEAIVGLFDEAGALREEPLAGAHWTEIDNTPAWDPERLKRNIFAGRIAITYAKEGS